MQRTMTTTLVVLLSGCYASVAPGGDSPPSPSCAGAPEIVAEVSDFAELRIAHANGELVALWSTWGGGFVRRRSAGGGWGPEVSVSAGLDGPFAVDDEGTAWGVSDTMAWRAPAGGPVTAMAVPSGAQLALAPSGAPMIAYPLPGGVGWGLWDGARFSSHEAASPGELRNPVLPVPEGDDAGSVVVPGTQIDVVRYRGDATEVVRIADAADTWGMRPASAVAIDGRLWVAYTVGPFGMSPQEIVVTELDADGVRTTTLDHDVSAREALLLAGPDGRLDALWVAGPLATMGEPVINTLRAARLEGGEWSASIDLAEVESDGMILSFAAVVADGGDLVVAYLGPDGIHARRRTTEWQPAVEIAPPSEMPPSYLDFAAADDGRVFLSYGEYARGSSRLVVRCLAD